MGLMQVDHPDIYAFVQAKSKEGSLSTFNLSVSATNEFMDAAIRDKQYILQNSSRNGKDARRVSAKDVFSLIAKMAWQNGEPGLVFIDTINAANPTPAIGTIEATNPCGEQPLLPYESCILGSVNLAKFEKSRKIDWEKLEEVVKIAVHFLDNAIDVTRYPSKKIENMTKSNRKIGLGVMGFADLLIELGIPYNSGEGITVAEEVMSFISRVARLKSIEIAETRGSFPNFGKSIYPYKGYTKLRNATVTTIAPTGSISLIAGCSSGIEPVFALVLCRRIMGRIEYVGLHPLFQEVAEKKSLGMKRIIREVAENGSIQGLSILPAQIRRIFVTALGVSSQYHVLMQAAFQKYTDNAVSKTVNLPYSATIDEVKNVLLLAYLLGCKGITIYRNRSRNEQILHYGTQSVTGEVPSQNGCFSDSCNGSC